MPRIALATAIAIGSEDPDMPVLLDACAHAGLQAEALAWDDSTVSWARFDAVVLRSTWNYASQRDRFQDWCRRVANCTTLFNPFPVIEWNTDKRYLAELARDGLPVIACPLVEPAADPLPVLRPFLAAGGGSGDFVVKPTVGASAKGARRFGPAQEVAAAEHLARLLDTGQTALLQPYLSAVDSGGETALVHIDGRFSHAMRKAALLTDADGAAGTETVTPCEAADDELAVARQALAAATRRFRLERPPLYARVDLIRDDAGAPRLLELELTEPSLFLAQAPDAAARLASALASRLRHP